MKRLITVFAFLSLASTLSAAATQHTATIIKEGEAYVCNSLLVLIPSHEVLVEQRVTVKAGAPGEAVFGSQSEDGTVTEHRMTCRVSAEGDRGEVFVKSIQLADGAITSFTTHESKVAVSRER